ncbi:hypothetical protein M407DRAFT_242162 [Tulasnella calospora MUT 4182]|uniref:Uncharacterized protein n=1 Tax=Tulasnella calospora MUT 4182 TaxID=1051891 RepID=A0A0C3L9F3_9AGAM|nr:hypothetical protein M407DRAFT_242162 [Tulasnella calospora MUT 4182]
MQGCPFRILSKTSQWAGGPIRDTYTSHLDATETLPPRRDSPASSLPTMVHRMPVTVLPQGERERERSHTTVRRSVSTGRPAYSSDGRPLVAVEAKPPFKEKVRRFFGMRPKRYIAYTPALAVSPSRATYSSPTTRTYQYNTYPQTQYYNNTGVRTHYSGGSVRTHPSGGSHTVYRTTTTRRRY